MHGVFVRKVVCGYLLLLLCVCSGGALAQQDDAQVSAEPATLRWANRDIAEFRRHWNGMSPAQRVDRAAASISALSDSERRSPVRAQMLSLQDTPAAVVMVGDRAILALFPGDAANPDTDLQLESQAITERLTNALAVDQLQRRPAIIARGAAISVAALALTAVLMWLLSRGGAMLEGWLQRRLLKHRQAGQMHWREYTIPVVMRLLLLLRWFFYLLAALVTLVTVLEAFPLTEPLGQRVLSFFGERLHVFGRATLRATPGIMTMLLILFITHGVAQAIGLFFNNVHSGRIQVPLAHPETALATKRLVTLLVWGVGVGLAYPYIPGAKSEAFKGISLFFGLMVSLGSAGVVSQLMSGLVVVYSRALGRGDRVTINGHEAVVQEIGGLATKLVNLHQQEITVPNSVLIGNAIVNHSKRAALGPVFYSAQVTIGYDTPWRQVHQILLDAVAATKGFASAPSPYVLQRALSDFYVEYEVFAALANPAEGLARKPQLMSDFHANIQDAFNAANVQIMSPHFEAQPEQAIVVPRAQWNGPAAAITPGEVLKDIASQPSPKPQ